jgi:hypothetical protein
MALPLQHAITQFPRQTLSAETDVIRVRKTPFATGHKVERIGNGQVRRLLELQQPGLSALLEPLLDGTWREALVRPRTTTSFDELGDVRRRDMTNPLVRYGVLDGVHCVEENLHSTPEDFLTIVNLLLKLRQRGDWGEIPAKLGVLKCAVGCTELGIRFLGSNKLVSHGFARAKWIHGFPLLLHHSIVVYEGNGSLEMRGEVHACFPSVILHCVCSGLSCVLSIGAPASATN